MIIIRYRFICLLALASSIFILSWFFISTNYLSIYKKSLPTFNYFSAFRNQNHDQEVKSSTGTRSILVDEDQEETEAKSLQRREDVKCSTKTDKILKVFMYDLPSQFHFALLDWKPKTNQIWPDIREEIPQYPGGLNLQHSIEYWLTLDLLESEIPDPSRPRNAVRVHNSSQADVIFVPFFSSLSYNKYSKVDRDKNRLLQEKLVKFLTDQDEWKRSGGKDHIVMAHHPNSMMDARTKLWPAMFILADFGRYPPSVANVDKDVIAPYKHLIKSYVNDSLGFDNRPTLLYFQGAIYRKDVSFTILYLVLLYKLAI